MKRDKNEDKFFLLLDKQSENDKKISLQQEKLHEYCIKNKIGIYPTGIKKGCKVEFY